MKGALPKGKFKSVQKTIKEKAASSTFTGRHVVAQGHEGVGHAAGVALYYAPRFLPHWTNCTAEKHDGSICQFKVTVSTITEFNRQGRLVQRRTPMGHPSPTAGNSLHVLRARDNTAWESTSPAFLEWKPRTGVDLCIPTSVHLTGQEKLFDKKRPLLALATRR